MAESNKNKHLTHEERKIIEFGIRSGATQKAIADTIGKQKSTVGKEIKNHRKLTYKCKLPVECADYAKCKPGHKCIGAKCPKFLQFKCQRRDRSPGACNGCKTFLNCRFNKYEYKADDAQYEYRETLVDSRVGANLLTSEAAEISNIVAPLLQKGQSPYTIVRNHPELGICERTLYNYINNDVLHYSGESGVTVMDLRRKVGRRSQQKKQNALKKRESRLFLQNRTYKDFLSYTESNPEMRVVEMDTVYNSIETGPFIQTFKFLEYGFLFALYHERLNAAEMTKGVDLLEEILTSCLFYKNVQIILTDRGSEFTDAEGIEKKDGNLRTRLFYCDPQASHQKGSLENNHIELRYILPHEIDLRQLGLVDQDALNMVLSHVNSIPIEKFGGKTPFDITEFMYPDLYEKLIAFGLRKIPVDELILKPSLLKDRRPDRKKKHTGGRKRKISSISPKEISQLADEGHSPKEIAERMGVSIATYYRRFPVNKK